MKLRADRAEDRKNESDDRAKERAARSPEDQMALLDHRLGKGVGAVKERKKLAEAIAARKKGK